MIGRDGARSAAPWILGAVVVTALAGWLPLWPSLAPLFTLDGFRELGDARLQRVLWRTSWISAAAAAVAVLLGGSLALLATRVRVPGARVLELLLPLPLFLPPLLVAAGWHGLTGMDGPWASAFSLGTSYAPFPALLGARALRRQSAAAHETALLAGGPRLAFGEMVRGTAPAMLLGGSLAFLFAATDFAVPDYFASVGESFDVYANVVFNAWRDFSQVSASEAANASLRAGAAAAAPLVLLVAVLFYVVLWLRDRQAAPETFSGRPPARLTLAGWRWPAGVAAWGAAAVMLLLPLGRIVYETGHAGPLIEEGWLTLSRKAFASAVERGREDLGRSLVTGLATGALVGMLAPIWAHTLLRLGRGALPRLLSLALALPLLVPAVGFGLGAIAVFNRDLFGGLYDSRWLPPLVMAGRFLPVAVFFLLERLQRVPREEEESAALAGASYRLRLFRYRLGPQRGAWLLAAGLAAVFAVRELDLAILLPAANASAAVRYYNALHFARDNFVAAFGLLIALVLFLPVMLQATLAAARRERSP